MSILLTLVGYKMTLKEIRKDFIEESGRYDFGVDTGDGYYSDNGADKYINRGMRMLQLLIDLPSADSVKTQTLTAGEKTITIARLSKVGRIEYKQTDDTWYPLTFLPQPLFLVNYPDAYNTDSDPASTGLNNYTIVNAIDDTGAYTGQTILFNTVLDEDITVRITYNLVASMTSDTDVNYFTMMYPELVVQAAMYQLEVSYRNTEGMKDWMNAMTPTLNGIDNITVKQDLNDEMVMEL